MVFDVCGQANWIEELRHPWQEVPVSICVHTKTNHFVTFLAHLELQHGLLLKKKLLCYYIFFYLNKILTKLYATTMKRARNIGANFVNF